MEGPVEHSKSPCQAQGSLACPDRRARIPENFLTTTTEPASGVSNSSPLLLTSLLGLLPAIASSLFHNRCHAMLRYALLCSAMLCSALLFLSFAWKTLSIPTCTRAHREPSTCLGFRLALHAIALSFSDARLLSHIILALASSQLHHWHAHVGACRVGCSRLQHHMPAFSTSR